MSNERQKANGYNMADERIEIIIGARDDFSKTFKSFRKASLAASAVFTTLGVLSAKAAIDFETGFTGVRKTVDATEKELADLEQEFRKLLRVTPITTKEILGVGEAAGQLGIKTKNIASFTKVMADLGATTNLAATEAATSLARLANITGLSQEEFDHLGSTIVGLGNTMATTESEIVSMGLRIAGAGAQAGFTEADMLALGATLSSVGVAAELGGTAISRLILEMNSAVKAGDEVGELFATIAGQTMPEFQKSFKEDAAGALSDFVKGLKAAKDRGQDLNPIIESLGFTGTRMKDVILRLTNASELLSGSLGESKKFWEENIALTKEANLKYQTTAAQLLTAKNRVEELGESYGKVLLPVIIEFLDVSDGVVEFLRESTPEFKIMAVQLGLIAGLVGPVAIGIKLIGKALMGTNPYLLATAVGFGGIQVVLAKLNTELREQEELLGLISTDNIKTAAGAKVAWEATEKAIEGYGVRLAQTEKLINAISPGGLEDRFLSGKEKGRLFDLKEEAEGLRKKISDLNQVMGIQKGLFNSMTKSFIGSKEFVDDLTESIGRFSMETAGAATNAAAMAQAVDDSLATLEMDGIQDRLAFHEDMNMLSVELDFIAYQERLALMDQFHADQAMREEARLQNVEAVVGREVSLIRGFLGTQIKDEKKQGDTKIKFQKTFANESLNALEAFGALSQSITGKNNVALLVLQKAAAVAQIIISTQVAASKALAEYPPPKNFIIAGLIVATGAMRVATVAATAIADGGLTRVAEEQTMIQVRGGERVLSPNQNRDFTQFLERSSPGTEVSGGGTGSGGGNVQIDNFELVLFPDASPTEVMLNMSQEDWVEVTNEKIIPALQDLNRAGLTAST